MNEELQKQITNMLQAALAAAQKGGEWLAGQIPDVLHQLIVWTIVKGFLSFGLWLAIWAVVGGFLIKLIKGVSNVAKNIPEIIEPKGYYTDVLANHRQRIIGMIEEYYYPCIFVFGGLGICNFVYTFFMWGNLFDAVQAWVAPKLFLLEYVSHMVKG